MLFLWTIACYSNFQMAGVIVNSSTHVPISPWSIPQTSNRKVRCDCTALIWNIHLTCEVLCCHLPCVNSMASIIEGPGRGRFEAPDALPCVVAPSDMVSLSRDYVLGEINRAKAPPKQAADHQCQTAVYSITDEVLTCQKVQNETH